VYHHDVVPYRLEDYTSQNLAEAVARIEPDAILAQFSAEAGEIFLKAFSRSGLTTKLYGSPFLLEEDWLAALPFNPQLITGCVAWSRELDTPANKTFIDTIASVAGKKANVFHLLGWEAAIFSTHFLTLQIENKNNLKATISRLEKAEMASPRGKLKPAPDAHYFFSPMYVAEVVQDEISGNSKLKVGSEISYLEEELNGFVSDLPAGPISRWTNTYLCI
jgi:branched-chain amino acid transport system substrate-binding protein